MTSQKELNYFQGSKREIDMLTKKLVNAEDQKSKFEKQLNKYETMNKRLNEQFEKSKKNVLNETGCEVNKQFSETLKDQRQSMEQMQATIDKLTVVESAYNSDKKMFYKTLEELNSQIEDFENKVRNCENEKAE